MTPAPLSIIQKVEQYVESELRDADQYDNRTPLDESGVWTLHQLVAEVYAEAHEDGERAADEKARRRASREERRAIAAVAAQ